MEYPHKRLNLCHMPTTCKYCSIRSRTLDELVLRGVETQAVTEFYGGFGSGKSQISHTLCATARQAIESGVLQSFSTNFL